MTDQVDYFSSDILFKKLWKSQKASNLHDFVYIKALFFSQFLRVLLVIFSLSLSPFKNV